MPFRSCEPSRSLVLFRVCFIYLWLIVSCTLSRILVDIRPGCILGKILESSTQLYEIGLAFFLEKKLVDQRFGLHNRLFLTFDRHDLLSL